MATRTTPVLLWTPLSLVFVGSLLAGCVTAMSPVRTTGDLAKPGPRVAIVRTRGPSIVNVTETAVLRELDAATGVFVVSDPRDARNFVTGLEAFSPDLIITLGALPMELVVRYVPDVPIVGGLVTRDETYLAETDRIAGVSIEPSTRFEFMMYKLVLPNIRSIGVLYDPAASRTYIRNARRVMRSLDLHLDARPVTSGEQVVESAKDIIESNDAIWLFSDPTVMTSENFYALRDYAIAHKKPLLCSGFDGLAQEGALMTVTNDYDNVGSQLATLARLLLGRKKTVSELGFNPPAGGSVIVNADVASKIGVAISDAARPLIAKTIRASAESKDLKQ